MEAGLLIGGRMDGIRGWLILNWLIGGITGLHPKFGALMGEKRETDSVMESASFFN